MATITIIVTIIDSKTFGFNKCNFGIRSGFKKKTHNFPNSVKRNTKGKFKFNTLRISWKKHFV